jgi:endonuclease YncB( thermonuclease family)
MARIRARTLRRAAIPLAGLLVLFVGLAQRNSSTEPVGERFRDVPARVTRVVDGDSIDVLTFEGARESVRYAGSVDTPESCEPGGREATALNASLTRGKEVILRVDRTNERDHYGRLLAYVFADDQLVQRELLVSGLASNRYREIANNPWQVEWDQWEREAWSERRGLWGTNWAEYSPERLPPRASC